MDIIRTALRKIFRVETITPDPLSRSFDQFIITRAPGLFYKVDNIRTQAGHIRLFASRPGRGFVFHQYNRLMEDWALERSWNFWLFCLYHVSPGKSTYPPGWHIAWSRIKIKVDRPNLYRSLSRREDAKARRRFAKMIDRKA